MTLSSDGRTWWARRRGKVVLKGSADAAGLYWVTLTRVQQRKVCTDDGERRQRLPRISGKSMEEVLEPHTMTSSEISRRFSPEFSRPAKFGWSRKIDEPLRSAQQNGCLEDDSQPSSEELPTSSDDEGVWVRFEPRVLDSQVLTRRASQGSRHQTCWLRMSGGDIGVLGNVRTFLASRHRRRHHSVRLVWKQRRRGTHVGPVVPMQAQCGSRQRDQGTVCSLIP